MVTQLDSSTTSQSSVLNNVGQHLVVISQHVVDWPLPVHTLPELVVQVPGGGPGGGGPGGGGAGGGGENGDDGGGDNGGGGDFGDNGGGENGDVGGGSGGESLVPVPSPQKSFVGGRLV